MPITKRLKVHQGTKGMEQCIKYVTNDSKTDGGILVSGINCTPTMATFEFKQNNNRYGKVDDDLSCYHIIQSFDFRDKITPKTVHEIGKKLCENLYPDFQCVVATHVDRGHLHNHIIVNATNTKGRKLVDRLADEKEGLYGLRNESDKLAIEHGCSIIYNAPKIGHYKKKNYDYYQSQANWKTVIKEKIDTLKLTCNSFEELLERLSLEGYVIKQGKHIAIKPYEKTKFVRMYKLGQGYTDEDLRRYFDKTYDFDISQAELDAINPLQTDTELQATHKSIARQSKDAIIYSSKGMKDDKEYPRYKTSRKYEIKRYNDTIEILKFLNAENIYSYEDIVERGNTNEKEIKALESSYLKKKSELNSMNTKNSYSEEVIKNFNEYKNYLEIKKSFPNAEVNESVNTFLQSCNRLSLDEKTPEQCLNEAREMIAKYQEKKRAANAELAKLTYLKHKQSNFEMLRMNTLEKQYIRGMSFSKKMIDESRSNEREYCVKLPYTKEYVFLPKENVVWTTYDVRAVMYLREDEEYYLYDENNQIVGIANGEEFDDISQQEKERIQSLKK